MHDPSPIPEEIYRPQTTDAADAIAWHLVTGGELTVDYLTREVDTHLMQANRKIAEELDRRAGASSPTPGAAIGSQADQEGK